MHIFKGHFIKHYYIALILTAIIVGWIYVAGGFSATLPLIALVVIEMTFSFDNAVINSHILAGISRFWRIMFLTVGIAIAVFGARFILPLVMVSATTDSSISHVLDLAVNNPNLYAQKLTDAYPVIAAFGGVFLLMVGLRFFGEKKKILWLDTVEAPLAEFNQPWWVSITGAIVATIFIYLVIAPGDERIAISATLGAVTFLTIKFLSMLLLRKKIKSGGRQHVAYGWAGFTQFLYLEILDASFSFDAVVAAFAITKNVLLIAAGLGIGALFVRSMTVHLLERGTLLQFRYLLHGAHYAITALAIMLIIGIRVHIPEVITGFLGLIIIVLAFESSRRHNRRDTSTA